MKSLKRWEAVFVVVVGLTAMLASAAALYVARHNMPVVAAAEGDDERPRFPLPAGPRKYQ
jgi:hypothetical protein